MAPILYLILTLSISLLLTKLIISLNNNKKKNYPPSPIALPIIGHLHLFKKPLHQTLSKLSTRYGPALFLRFGARPVLVVSSSELAEECFTKNDVVFANRVHFASSKDRTYNYSGIGSANYGPHWRNIRRIAKVEILSSHRLNGFNDMRKAQVNSMVKGLFDEYTKSAQAFAKVELKSRLFGFALNNMMRMVGGKRYRLGEEKAAEFQESVEASFSMSGASNVGDFLPLPRWINFQRWANKSTRLTKYIDGFLQGLIDDHRRVGKQDGQEEEKTMIGVLLSLQKTDPEYYNDQIIKALISSLLAAGTDTSSNSIEWAMTLLLNNPEKLRKARAEIDEQIGSTGLVQESDLSKLQYLQCVITEALRLYPAGPLLVPHESAEECIVGGYYVPRGTMLLVNAYSIHRDPKYWDEPEMFIPERFQDASNEEHYKLLPFGMGRRRCPGEGLARRVAGLLLGTLIQCFEWERPGDELVDMTEGSGLTLPKAVPLQAMYRPRETMMDILSCI